MEALGPQLRALRTAAGRTVASVAADAGLSVPYIANLENGRGNPTVTALDRLASALGVRLRLTLDPADSSAPAARAAPVKVPASLVRFARTRRFRRAVEVIAAARALDRDELTRQLVHAMAGLGNALHADLGDTDWGRILDALLLVVTQPGTDERIRGGPRT